MILEITGKDFELEVLKSELLVFACFTASWCRSCFPLCLEVEAIAKEYDQMVKFVRIDAENEPELMAKYHILPLPAVLLFQDSEPIKKLLGFHYKQSLKQMLNSVIAGGKHSS